ncbi:MAG TPA: gamma-glutamyl-gamma-aminobutyrate hydrolase family protein [Pyrinomonadaceae bacterium]|jgi:putative glutamine amidotransferase|nr:gamma-glutamyl-gamma-aminobutyrate hydrolase family protein [Pyrinomonadaceae bacterium]
MIDERPRIGLTMRLEMETGRFYLGRDYCEALEAAGGVPLHIGLIPKTDYIRGVLDGLDAILLPGSDSDVDPARYGREPQRHLGTVQPLKDETDALVLAEMERRGMPLLAICFGMQILNVARGGTLIQDIASQMPEAIKHQQGAPRDRRSHRVRLLEGSLLEQLAGAQQAPVNSHHHQAIETVGRELLATAWTADGLVEALEDARPDRFALAVQWHPEIAWESDALSLNIFGRFVQAAREFAHGPGGRLERLGAESGGDPARVR